MSKINYTNFEGSSLFRLKIAYSFLLNRPIKISNIRSTSVNPGLSPYESSFLKLISSITNGTEIQINQTGTGLTLKPGTITNNYGDLLTFTCDKSRAVTYYAEGLIPISLYGKESLQINLIGITNNHEDNSVDSFRLSTCILLQKLIVGDKVECKIKRRGMLPNGEGEIFLKIPIITGLAPFDWKEEGKIRRVRGVAFTSKLGPNFTTQMVDKARGILNNILPDVWIAVENYKSKDLDKISPGFGITLCAETKNGFCLCSDKINEDVKEGKNAFDISAECVKRFLDDIYKAGCVGVDNQGLFLFLMSLSEKNIVSYMKLGRLSEGTKEVIRFIYKYIGVKFHVRECDEYDYAEEENEENNEENNEESNEESDEENKEDVPSEKSEIVKEKQFMFSCIGVGLKNVARIEL